ncbi:hypothetical protein C8J56DRAFT_1063051 [Mycena floridula]|nr:hypothetical protein C8J56DRAFT_1063051 [Mycena floridula]
MKPIIGCLETTVVLAQNMGGTRRSTIHDLSALRLHRDGTRVDIMNRGNAKYSTPDIQGGFIAEDADKAKAPSKAALRRLLFDEDLSFLNAPVNVPPEDGSLPLPSSDLLKCIHRLSAEYYDERGFLVNASKQYRKEKKERRDRRKLEESGLLPEDDEENDQEAPTPANSRDRRIRDMYKIMNGSALMAIVGMLVQEYMMMLIKRGNKPEGWPDMELDEEADGSDQMKDENQEENRAALADEEELDKDEDMELEEYEGDFEDDVSLASDGDEEQA